ncbi:Copper amine oxidase N-terminal domain-containing protein [Paenibacillus sp. UNCCL117]|uniref:stalk domain-containing protein n=1 Tax=unclassified Paenibacillus TaxID=185978 RepID=UPI0008921644|nr:MULTISPECIES: stalk domain-containing protein [unclassified Paenibacillus]SDC72027.1 Copper amine oxidase N-terminal domain-containing protein [Paenibacillus sp. cl123]SFW24652.1 Copper amine oxidase N-terminal domain-containing protein [Paenibacillus sp. UNCCL117]
MKRTRQTTASRQGTTNASAAAWTEKADSGKEAARPPAKRRSAAARSFLAAALGAGLLLAGVAPAHADEIWNRWQAADKAVAAGNAAGAVPHWEFLVNHYAGIGDWQNAALFCGRLNVYFDSVGDYERAIAYYELENQYWLKDGKDWGAVDLQRAEQIRTIVEAYISTSDTEALRRRALPAGGKLAKFEPEYGMYIGMYTERDPKMLNYFDRSESIYGKKHALYLAYTQVGKPFPKQYADRAKQAGAGLQIGWEPMNGLDAVTDAVVRQWAKEAKAAGIPIFLRYASEMNGNWIPWHGDPDKYIRSFRMVHDIMEQEAPNVAMVWSPGDVPMYSMDAYYPGDDYVDWVGVSLYSEPYENGDPQQGNMQATSPVERLDYLYRTYAERKPIMISETAVSHYANIPKESFTDYGTLNLQRLYGIMPYKYPRLKSVTYFNVNLEMSESKNNYLLRDNDAMMSLYKKLIAPSYYLTKIEQGAKPSDQTGLVPLEDGRVFYKQASITPFVKIPDIYIGKIAFSLNGKLLEEQTAPPYGLQLKAGQVPDGSVLGLTVYNKSGRQVASKSFPLTSGISIALNGKDLTFEQPPVIREGNTLAPIRAVFEAMGATVEWNAATKTATARKGSKVVSIAIGSREAYVDNKPVTLEVPAQLIGGSTLVPARFASEAFGGVVSWDGTTRTVQIRSNGQASASAVSASAVAHAPVMSASAASTGTGSADRADNADTDAKADAAEESPTTGWLGWIKLQLGRLAGIWDRLA